MPNVVEIEQKDLQSSLENLRTNSRIAFTDRHNTMHDYISYYAGPDSFMYNEDVNKLLVAKNEQNQVVGIGIASFRDGEGSAANLDILLSVEKGAGKAIVEGIIDYSRQMENRADLSLNITKENLKSYYAKFGFVQAQAVPGRMVRQKSAEFNPYRAITKFNPLSSTNQDVNNKRVRAAAAMRR